MSDSANCGAIHPRRGWVCAAHRGDRHRAPDGEGDYYDWVDEPPEAFVLTDNGVVHQVTCSHVTHQVEQHERTYEVQVFPEHEFIGHDSEGWSVYRERPATKPAGPYSAHYVTASDLAGRRARYRRCRTCAPDVAEWVKPERKSTSIRARSLTSRHLGRVVEGAGEVVRISVVLHTTAGDIVVGMDDHVALEPRRESDDIAPNPS